MKPNHILTGALAAFVVGSAALFAADPANKSVLNATDETFVKKAAQHGKSEVQIAELGAKKAEKPEVKAFAETLIKDHGALNEELKGLAKAKGVELSVAGSPEADETIKELEQKFGKDFDAEFLDEMEDSHKKSIDLFEDASENAKDADLKAWVDKALPILRTHHDRVKTLEEAK